jgi:hypothetical protein
MFDFPNAPINGQLFTPIANGPSYMYQNPVWRLVSGGVNPGFWVGDAPPSNPVQGTLWWESDSGNSFIWYDDGSSAQWVQFNIAPPVVALPSFIKRTVFSASTTTFQFDPATMWAQVDVQGGGGAGGGTAGSANGTGTTFTAAAGSGGGGGGHARKSFQVTPEIRAATKTITVAAASASNLGNGNNGGNTSYDDTVNTLTGLGGSGGTGGAQSAQQIARPGGAGASSSGGDSFSLGAPGGPSWSSGGGVISGSGAVMCGNGGKSFLGLPGTGAAGSQNASAASLPGNGGSYGAGGSGGYTNGAVGSNVQGGAGGAGLVIISEYR